MCHDDLRAEPKLPTCNTTQIWDIVLLEENVDLLELRFHTLNDVVDHFVVAEMPFSMKDNSVMCPVTVCSRPRGRVCGLM